VLASLLFSLYHRFSDPNSTTYGADGGVIVLMLWLYFLGFAVVMGGEINAEIAHARENLSKPHASETTGVAPDASPIVRAFTPGAGEATAIAVKQLLDMLAHENQHVRAATLASLRSAGPAATAALPVVVRALDDQDPEVRQEASKTLDYIVEQQREVSRIAEAARSGHAA
jgi:hypothetical protein